MAIKLPVLNVSPTVLTERALVVGDPRRAKQAARLLYNSRQVGNNREYVTYTGLYNETPLTICSHGVGAAGASVCFQELIKGGVRLLVRAGTCGALKEEIEDGSLVVATSAIREDGTSDQLIPLAYPACADASLLLALQQEAAAMSFMPVYTGVVLTQAHLYPGLLPTTIDFWQQAGAVCVEMELAVLLVIASMSGARAGGIFTSDGNLAKRQKVLNPEDYHPQRAVVAAGIDKMVSAALTALVNVDL
jgi:uridine phosphorylase